MRENIIAANWKMNHTGAEVKEFFSRFLASYRPRQGVTVVVAPPGCYLAQAAQLAAGAERVHIGAQNMYFEAKGAFTGELSAAMLKDSGCSYVILGHSERRHVFGETDELISRKVSAALEAGLVPIFCIGELLGEREAGHTEEVVSHQLKAVLPSLDASRMARLVIAYEPVWAIGTGRTATPEQAQEIHALTRGIIAGIHGRELADKVVILYGGSVKPDNVDSLMAAPDIDGALVGGASLEADSFLRLVNFS
ncbi:MAG: triose-phosphate isomerase [Candidatus Glassbacteria bacterium]|nr:triose-phosphate isomerase [Candidatus Glassbacteria bacterium]